MIQMRIKDKAIGIDKVINLLTECKYGALSTVSNNGHPYGLTEGKK